MSSRLDEPALLHDVYDHQHGSQNATTAEHWQNDGIFNSALQPPTRQDNLPHRPFLQSRIQNRQIERLAGPRKRRKPADWRTAPTSVPSPLPSSWPSAVFSQTSIFQPFADAWSMNAHQLIPAVSGMRGGSNTTQNTLVLVHCQKQYHPQSATSQVPVPSAWIPESRTLQLSSAGLTVKKAVLEQMKSTVVHAKYTCGCRSRGICVHFTYLFGARRLNDGLICGNCEAHGTEYGYQAGRNCVKHNVANWQETRRGCLSSRLCDNLSEDILATDEQHNQARAALNVVLCVDG